MQRILKYINNLEPYYEPLCYGLYTFISIFTLSHLIEKLLEEQNLIAQLKDPFLVVGMFSYGISEPLNPLR